MFLFFNVDPNRYTMQGTKDDAVRTWGTSETSFRMYDEPTLAEELRAAVDAYKERLLRGLGGMCNDEIEARIAEFIAKHKPEDGSQEEMAAFYEKLLAYMRSLFEIKNREHVEKLLTTPVAEDGDQWSPLRTNVPNAAQAAAAYSKMLATVSQ